MNETVKQTMSALERNNIKTFYAETAQEVLPIVKTLIKKGDVIACGGSTSIKQAGIMELIENGDYNFYDRNAQGLTPEQRDNIYAVTVNADAYFCSSNAVTKKGELVNVDGFCNRIASIAFGPKSVIMVVSVNKIVDDIPAAVLRVHTVAAPKNCVRLGKNTYCAKMGECVSIGQGLGTEMTAGCDSSERICRNYIISGKQGIKDRIKVIFCGEPLGY